MKGSYRGAGHHFTLGSWLMIWIWVWAIQRTQIFKNQEHMLFILYPQQYLARTLSRVSSQWINEQGTWLVSSESGITVSAYWKMGLGIRHRQWILPCFLLTPVDFYWFGLTSIASTFFRQQNPDFPVICHLISIFLSNNPIWVDRTTLGSGSNMI